MECSLRSADVFPVVASLPPKIASLIFGGRETTTANMSALRRLCGVLFFICFIIISNKKTAVLALMIISNPEIRNRPGFLFDFLHCMSIATQQTHVLEFVKCLLHRGYEENFGKFSAVVGLFLAVIFVFQEVVSFWSSKKI